MFARILRKGVRSWDTAQRAIQSLGLEQGSAVARRLLKEPQCADDETLCPWQEQTLAALMERLCHDPAGRLPSPRECGAVAATVAFISKMPAARKTQLRQLLTLFEAAPMLLGVDGERARFSKLEEEAQDAHIGQWAESSITQRRAVFQGLKSACMVGYWSCPATWPEIGYSVEDTLQEAP